MGLQGYVGDASDARKIRAIEAKRAADREALEKAKREAESKSSATALREFGTGETEAAEAAFKAGTVGLVTREQFLATRDRAEAAAEEEKAKNRKRKLGVVVAGDGKSGGGGGGGGGGGASAAAAAAKRAAARGKLSFGDDDDDEGEEEEEEEDGEDEDEDEQAEDEEEAKKAEDGGEAATAATTATTTATTTNQPQQQQQQQQQQQRNRLAKDPTVRTDFLPDADEEAREAALRASFLEEFEKRREREKAAPLDIVFSYWDGAGHRRSTTVAAGSTVGAFLGKARAILATQFRELRSASASDLLYIKEDCILPHDVTFHDLISRKARGKSGPLFHFDVRDDVRLQSDATREKDESHAGKVVTRSWYNRNKHMFPASRWEVWDSSKGFEGGYTVKGR